MSTAGHFTEHLQMPLSGADVCWYAVQTRSRHERVVAAQLREQGVSTFLPMITEIRRWSDRRKLVEFPLFSGYVFVHAAVSPRFGGLLFFSIAVAGFFPMQGGRFPIPAEQIDKSGKTLPRNLPWAC